jgi:hypothetical protein
MTEDGLVERLRGICLDDRAWAEELVIREAADRILALTEAMEKMREALGEAFDFLGGVDDAAEIRGKLLDALTLSNEVLP